jgi:mannose-6-phosphate isomerase-like protein (cupin superfamily)
MAPVLLIGVIAFFCVDRRLVTLRACLAVYALAVLVTFAVPSPVGSNVARMGTLLAAPLTTVVFWRRRPRLLALAIVPLLYIGWEAPARDLSSSSGDASVSTAYYRPLMRFLHARRHAEGPFRIEIPFTKFHWEAYVVATHFPIARGWERQLDIRDNPIFYRQGALTATTYREWLHANAIRYVAAPDAELDYSSHAEMALIDSGPPYLRLVDRTAHWRIYEVRGWTPLAEGAARLTHLGPDWFRLRFAHAGSALVHVRYSPYWEVTQGRGCVAQAGRYLRVTAGRSGFVRLETHFAPDRIGASSPRCT